MSFTKWHILLLAFAAMFVLRSPSANGQNAPIVTASGDDLHYLGYVLLTGDTMAWVNIADNDIFYLSKSIYFRSTKMLDFIQNDNLYFFGNALITANKTELQKITDDDWFYLGSAMFEKTLAYLENVTNDDVYYLGNGVIKRDINFLNRLSTTKK